MKTTLALLLAVTLTTPVKADPVWDHALAGFGLGAAAAGLTRPFSRGWTPFQRRLWAMGWGLGLALATDVAPALRDGRLDQGALGKTTAGAIGGLGLAWSMEF